MIIVKVISVRLMVVEYTAVSSDFDEDGQPGAEVVGVSGVEDLGGRGRSDG